MTGLKRNFAASSDNELVVRLRQSGGQVTHFAWACPITSNRRWPSGLVGSRTGPRMVPFTGVLWKAVTVVCGEDARVLLSSPLLPINSRPKTVQRGHRLTGPALLRVPDLWRMVGHVADAHVRGAGMFDNSFSGPSDASNDLEWGPVFCIWPLVNSLTAYAYDYERRLFSLSLFEFHQNLLAIANWPHVTFFYPRKISSAVIGYFLKTIAVKSTILNYSRFLHCDLNQIYKISCFEISVLKRIVICKSRKSIFSNCR